MSKSDNIILVIIATVIIFIFIVAGRMDSMYTMDTEVVSIEKDMIVLESSDGNLWEYSLPDNTFKIGTKIKCYMNSMETDTLKDDVIVKLTVARDLISCNFAIY